MRSHNDPAAISGDPADFADRSKVAVLCDWGSCATYVRIWRGIQATVLDCPAWCQFCLQFPSTLWLSEGMSGQLRVHEQLSIVHRCASARGTDSTMKWLIAMAIIAIQIVFRYNPTFYRTNFLRRFWLLLVWNVILCSRCCKSLKYDTIVFYVLEKM